jgi:hypothetical protein
MHYKFITPFPPHPTPFLAASLGKTLTLSVIVLGAGTFWFMVREAWSPCDVVGIFYKMRKRLEDPLGLVRI